MSPSRSGSLESLRERNRLRVVDLLRHRGSASRAEIARETGLSRTTVSSLVADLIEVGMLNEIADPGDGRASQAGRPPILLALSGSTGALVGVDFGHSHLRVAVADLAFNVLAEAEVDVETDLGSEVSLDTAANLVSQVLTEAAVDRSQVLGAGMGLPGPIELDSGRVDSRRILPGWVDVDPAEELAARLGIPVHIDNDANAGALGESRLGAGRDSQVMAYVRLSAGIGLGIVIDGRPFRGARGTAGEIGHVLVDPTGRICRCGNRGCLETLVSGPALCELLMTSHGEMGVDELVSHAVDGDVGCRRAIEDAGRTVGRAMADVCNYINPDTIVVGGELSRAGGLIVDPIREAIGRYAIPAATAELRVVAGVLGDRAEMLGALTLAGHQSEQPILHSKPEVSSQRREIHS
jgi:predicted NBD/HSP70 family sugar kinase